MTALVFPFCVPEICLPVLFLCLSLCLFIFICLSSSHHLPIISFSSLDKCFVIVLTTFTLALMRWQSGEQLHDTVRDAS